MRIFATLAAAAFLTAATLSARADAYSSIVVYGDSLSDNGNLYNATGQPGYPYVNGRFSNGPVSVEQLAGQLNTPLVDFAFGGATTGVGNIGDHGTPTSAGAFHLPGIAAEYSGSQGMVPPAALINALFIVWGGADDFEALLATTATPTTQQIEATAANAAGNIDGIVAALQAQGAKNILVPNLPNLGGTPEFSGNPAAIDYSDTFNTALAAYLPAGATLFDTNAVFTAIQANKSAYGFTNVTTPCIAVAANPACTGYLFFDDIHPTTAGDTILANDFAAAVAPEPSSLMLLGTGLAGVAALLRRRRVA